MVLNSFTYMVFLCASAFIHRLLPSRYRNYFLLCCSIVFCAWYGIVHLTVAFFVGFFSFAAAKWIIKQKEEQKKKSVLAVSIILLLLILSYFKYAGVLGNITGFKFASLFPVGISFYTIEVIGYLLDICHGKTKTVPDFLSWLTGTVFFPKLLSGPICRSDDLLPQLKSRDISYENITEGLRRILMGAMAKVVLADGFAAIINEVYSHVDDHSGLAVTIAMILYPLQIYFDFCGYSGMAVGSALLFGIRLKENFQAPFLATDLANAWKRWHISLTSWLQDYIFIPLVWSRWWDKLFNKNRISEKKPAVLPNIIIVFLISGIWHGSSLNYLIWGLLMGVGRVLEEIVPKRKKKSKTVLAKTAGRLKVYLWWMITHLFFRLSTPGDVLHVVKVQFKKTDLTVFKNEMLNLFACKVSNSGTHYLIFTACILFALCLQIWFDSKIDKTIKSKNTAVINDPLKLLAPKFRWIIYWLMGFATAAMYLISQTGDSPSFIYLGY